MKLQSNNPCVKVLSLMAKEGLPDLNDDYCKQNKYQRGHTPAFMENAQNHSFAVHHLIRHRRP
jgi:hypothetical protein